VKTARARKRSLAIVERAHRGLVEEQYGHILWLSRIIRKMRAEHGLLLRGNASLAALRGQRSVSIDYGHLTLDTVSNPWKTVECLVEDGVAVYVVNEDLERLRLTAKPLIQGVVSLDRLQVVELFKSYDCIWYW
jgi:sulfur relay (sulfurtransferase) DsrF/TusC family protein